MAVPASLALTRYRVPGSGPILSFMMLPLVVPSIVLAVALLVIILRILDLPLSLWTVAAGHLMICIPFAMTVLMSRLEGFDRSLEEASRDLGAGGWSTFRRVTLPLAAPAVISSLLLCFIISFDEFVIAFFLTGTETTLPIFLFSQLRFPNRLPGTLALRFAHPGGVGVACRPGRVASSPWRRPRKSWRPLMTADQGAPIISICDITKSFGTFKALKGINFDIARGEFFSLLGASGCGKTTLLRILAGIEEPTTGKLLHRRSVHGGHSCQSPADQHGFPELCNLSASLGPRERRLWPRLSEDREGRGRTSAPTKRSRWSS